MPAEIADTAYWIDPDGNQYNLEDTSRFFIPSPGLSGGGYGVPLEVITFEQTGIDGDFEQYIKVHANDVRVPLLIFGETPGVLEMARRELLEATRPSRGLSYFQVGRTDGTFRQLACREIGRFRDIGAYTPSMIQTGLILRAADPYWQDTNDVVTTLAPSGPVNFFQNPFLPVHLSPSSASGSFAIENNGQALTWPKWIITGPGTNPVLTNSTTGEVLTLNITLIAGQVLTIDTDPAIGSVAREDGSNQWGAVDPASSLWPLGIGVNAITLTMAGTSGASQLQLLWRRRWESC